MSLVSHSKGKVLITGATGFTGQHLLRHLQQQGYEVIAAHRQNFKLDDITSMQVSLQQWRPDYVVHLAAIAFVGHTPVEDFYRLNVLATDNLLSALRSSGIPLKKVILASSATVYGNQGVAVLSEALCPRPVNHYGISKLAMEQRAATYFAYLPIIITRPFNYVGVGQSSDFVVAKIAEHFKQGKTEIQLGNLQVAREFNSIDYVCQLYQRLLTSAAHSQVVNLCSGQAVALHSIIDMLQQIAGYRIDVKVNPQLVRANELSSLVGDTARLTQLVGDLPHSDLYQTLITMYHA